MAKSSSGSRAGPPRFAKSLSGALKPPGSGRRTGKRYTIPSTRSPFPASILAQKSHRSPLKYGRCRSISSAWSRRFGATATPLQVSANLTTNSLQAESNVAFDFVRTLAAELSRGNVDLPSFPEIAVRVRRVLSDPKTSVNQVVRVVGSEPALAARLLRIANSASLNRSGRPVTDLRTAINRIGYNMVRSASMSFSMAQIRKSNKLAGLQHHLADLWQSSTSAAALAYVLARNCTRVNPDEAMLTGMMHGIGKLYVLTRAIDHPALFANETALNEIIADWHASIGKAILENWNFSEAMAQAVGEQANVDRSEEGPADLSDVIAIAILMASHGTEVPDLGVALHELGAAKRLGLNSEKAQGVMRESAAEVNALSQALGS
jgi:HD-like signal output (HDOD) protein